MLGKKRVKSKHVKGMQQHFKCLKIWQNEAENRERKQAQGKVEKTRGEGEESQSRDTHTLAHPHTPPPPPYNPLYPSLTSWNDPTLLECPIAPAPEPQAQAAAPVAAPRTARRPKEEDEQRPKPTTKPRRVMTTRSMAEQDKPNVRLAFNMPMIQAAGPAGPQLVYRPWSYKDMVDNTGHLPKPSDGGQAFVHVWKPFCREFAPTFPEIKRILHLLLGPVDFEKIKGECGGQEAMGHPDWSHDDNIAYRTALDRLCAAITTAFPVDFDLTKVTSCTQTPSEPVDNYLHRLMEIFTAHGGMVRPADVTVQSPWEQQLTTYFLQGLLPAIAAATRLSCVGWKKARLEL